MACGNIMLLVAASIVCYIVVESYDLHIGVTRRLMLNRYLKNSVSSFVLTD